VFGFELQLNCGIKLKLFWLYPAVCLRQVEALIAAIFINSHKSQKSNWLQPFFIVV